MDENPSKKKEKDFDFDGESDEDDSEDGEGNFADDKTEVPNQTNKIFGERENERTFSGGLDSGNTLMKSQSYLFSKGDLAFPQP